VEITCPWEAGGGAFTKRRGVEERTRDN